MPEPAAVGLIRPFVVVANRWAGGGKAHGLIGEVERALRAPAIAIVEPDFTPAFPARLNEALASASAALMERSNSFDRPLLVCIGGDGTLSLAFDALASPDNATLAIIPCGSGNDLALMLGIRKGRAAFDVLRDGAERRIDYGTVNGRRFINCVGMGLDAEVAAMAAQIRKSGLAKGLSYYMAAVRGLLMVKPVAAMVVTHDVELRFADLVMLTVGNGAWYGGGFHGAPDASLEDGAFDCYAFRDVVGLPARFGLMQRIRTGAHADEPNVTSLRASHLEVAFERPVAMHVDGELALVQSAKIELVPRGARVIAPVE
ncbi:MAG TPA: YegS/Rv2252/BmrU family lipid kinase [Candidatus Eremiobacteraceae bacterium]|nr:YegS/Rv2252/BmrU family lipid kinase [Candidatus Eremiobacteraceae bacterium]